MRSGRRQPPGLQHPRDRHAHYHAAHKQERLNPADADVLVAVWESERTVKVTRGENSGRALSNSRIVRRLERVAAAGQPGKIAVKLDPSWKGTGAVVFAQRRDKRIVASALLPR